MAWSATTMSVGPGDDDIIDGIGNDIIYGSGGRHDIWH